MRFGARRDATLELVGYLLRWSYARFLSYYTRFLAYLPKLVHPPLPSHLGLLKALALSSDRARAIKRLAEGKQKKKRRGSLLSYQRRGYSYKEHSGPEVE